MAVVDLSKKRSGSHGSNPDTYDRQVMADDVSGTSVAASGVVTGAWIDALALRKVTAVGRGASATLTVNIDADHTGTGTADETFSGTLANPSVVTVKDLLTRQVRIRIVNGATIQNITGTILAGN